MIVLLFRNVLLITMLLMGVLLSPIQAQAVGSQADYSAGVQAFRGANYEEAVRYFNQLLTREPENVNARYYLALSLDHLSKSAEAAQAYQIVVARGTETRIVDYSRKRLQLLQPEAQDSETSTASVPAKSNSVALVAASNQAVPAAYRGTAQKVAVPLKSNRNALMVDALLSNQNTRAHGTFIIDTGATYTSISKEMAQKLGLDLSRAEMVRITTANGRIEVPKVKIPRLIVNGLEARDVEATVIQVRAGSSFHGLLGLSFIRQFVLTIDPEAGQLIFQKN